MWPNRVGGIAADLRGGLPAVQPGAREPDRRLLLVGLGSDLRADRASSRPPRCTQWYLPGVPVTPLAIAIVLLFTRVNLCGVNWVARLAIPVAAASALLAFLSALVPDRSPATVDWHQARRLPSRLRRSTAVSAIVTERDGRPLPDRLRRAGLRGRRLPRRRDDGSQPQRAARDATPAPAMAGLYFIVLPVVWLGVLGPGALGGDLDADARPDVRAAARQRRARPRRSGSWSSTCSTARCSRSPAPSRTLSQLAEDGLLPRLLGQAHRARDVPLGRHPADRRHGDRLPARSAIPIWMIAAANFTYLIGICLPNVAVWLLRRDAPDRERPYRAPRGTIMLGLVAAGVWARRDAPRLPAVRPADGPRRPRAGLLRRGALRLARSGRTAAARACRASRSSLHIKLTGAMLLVHGARRRRLPAGGQRTSTPDNHALDRARSRTSSSRSRS